MQLGKATNGFVYHYLIDAAAPMRKAANGVRFSAIVEVLCDVEIAMVVVHAVKEADDGLCPVVHRRGALSVCVDGDGSAVVSRSNNATYGKVAGRRIDRTSRSECRIAERCNRRCTAVCIFVNHARVRLWCSIKIG